ncbi:hypothetical protein NW766_005905 [Fusarium irregulare]|uniref:Uncharacterized protein n=1 Tax=Fusarium irregulare TaxID=2494466 RepID=A0A9W8PS49_9HYPO|nr:hypothetical protein NW766_005905 [Fusarium irregulare]
MHDPTILTNVITLSIKMALAVKQKYDVDIARINYDGAPGVHTINKAVEVTELKTVSVNSV